MKNLLQKLTHNLFLVMAFVLVFSFSLPTISSAQDIIDGPTPPDPVTSTCKPGNTLDENGDPCPDTTTDSNSDTGTSSGGSGTTGGSAVTTPKQGVNSAKLDRDLQCYKIGVGGSKKNTGVVLIDGSTVEEDSLPRCKADMPVWPGATAAREKAAKDALAAQKAKNLTPCDGVGKWYLAGLNAVPCEIWYVFSVFALEIAGALTKLSADLFDFTTQKFVLQISTLFQDESGADSEFIYGGWSIIRDLANIAAFFGAVYTGFRYITGSDGLDFKKAVTKLILYCLMVNFSFPIAKFLIDISNIISLQIYGGITDYKAGSGLLSRNILANINLNTLVSKVGSSETSQVGFSSFAVMWLSIIYLFASFGTFLYASLMILVRVFILFICVILSPLMFLNFAFPKLTDLHDKWRENFFGQILFAPILMFGFWLSFILFQAASIDTPKPASINNSNATSALPNVGKEYQKESECKAACPGPGGKCNKDNFSFQWMCTDISTVAQKNSTQYNSASDCELSCKGGSCIYESTTKKHMCVSEEVTKTANDYTTLQDTSTGEMAKLINMLLAILSLILTVKLAGSVSGGVGKSVSGFVGGAMKNVGLAAATGGTGLLARNVIGRAGASMAGANWIKNTGSENGASRRVAASLFGGAGSRMANMSLAGTKSFNEKRTDGADKAKEILKSENSLKIKNTGMTDLIAQAKTKDEVKKATEEMERRDTDKSYKGNNDLFGREAEKKAFQNNQSDLKDFKAGNVGVAKKEEFFGEKENLRALQNQNSKFDRGVKNTELRNERLSIVKDGSIAETNSRIEDLKNTNGIANTAYGVGKAIGTVKSEIKEEAKGLSDFLRNKKTFSGPAPIISSKLATPLVSQNDLAKSETI